MMLITGDCLTAIFVRVVLIDHRTQFMKAMQTETSGHHEQRKEMLIFADLVEEKRQHPMGVQELTLMLETALDLILMVDVDLVKIMILAERVPSEIIDLVLGLILLEETVQETLKAGKVQENMVGAHMQTLRICLMVSPGVKDLF